MIHLMVAIRLSPHRDERTVDFLADCEASGNITTRRVSEGPTYVASATSATNPSLTRRVVMPPQLGAY
jgi:hypothetical protein